ncbi:transposable element Tc1 transposase [Trichonephila clavipes]|nr:transposable element Tc1 transposase [Trichonephila clavipes]
MPRERHRASFDQVSEFDRGRIIAYRDWGLSFRKIDPRVGRNKATVMRICHSWIQEETTDQWGRSHPPRCTTAHDDRRIVRMAIMDRAATSRTLAKQIQSVTHVSVSAWTIRHPLQHNGMSARHPIFRLLLTGNHRRLCREWCDERRT